MSAHRQLYRPEPARKRRRVRYLLGVPLTGANLIEVGLQVFGLAACSGLAYALLVLYCAAFSSN